MSKSDDILQPDAIKKTQYVLILVFAAFAGFVGGVFSNRFHVIVDKILLSGGISLSFLGVVLLIESKIYRKKGIAFEGHVPLKAWMYNCGWIALILGVVSQIIGIWIT